MRVLITGGAGYIGTELTYKLAENTDVEKIIVLDNFERDKPTQLESIYSIRLPDILRFRGRVSAKINWGFFESLTSIQ